MDQHISIVLLFIFITGAHSLRCHECPKSGTCQENKTCPNGHFKCATMTTINDFDEKINTTKSCEIGCVNRAVTRCTTITTKCCDTDNCNGTDGLYKGGFIMCPLIFFILFH
ncbi:lymphocyte antigen 6D-like [Misgurnus anguillicaudatus]|uniref:lymphocyte antigen 6D-like n=1 Tax=Misgurnus anguillicaudatus TaxID=75329 RepID=UPI003CCFCD59